MFVRLNVSVVLVFSILFDDPKARNERLGVCDAYNVISTDFEESALLVWVMIVVAYFS